MNDRPAPEWARFRVGAPERPPRFAPDCAPFSTMSHVAHREPALTIMREGVLRAGLVFDESRLNTSRIRVTWLSPNYWANGFRYGNVQYTYDWPTLTAGMRAYWVEVIPYRVPACRILLTDRAVDDPVLADLTPYDPTQRDGPWWYDRATNQHYYNGNHTLEIMLERDLPLAACQTIDFVTHHRQMCSVDPGACPDRGLTAARGGAQVIAAMVARGIGAPVGLLTQRDGLAIMPKQALRIACTQLWSDLYRMGKACTGEIGPAHASAAALARGLLGAYARAVEGEDVQHLAALFQNKMALIHSCAMVVAEAFDITDRAALEAEEWAAA